MNESEESQFTWLATGEGSVLKVGRTGVVVDVLEDAAGNLFSEACFARLDSTTLRRSVDVAVGSSRRKRAPLLRSTVFGYSSFCSIGPEKSYHRVPSFSQHMNQGLRFASSSRVAQVVSPLVWQPSALINLIVGVVILSGA